MVSSIKWSRNKLSAAVSLYEVWQKIQTYKPFSWKGDLWVLMLNHEKVLSWVLWVEYFPFYWKLHEHEYARTHFELESEMSKNCQDGAFSTDTRTVVSPINKQLCTMKPNSFSEICSNFTVIQSLFNMISRLRNISLLCNCEAIFLVCLSFYEFLQIPWLFEI